MKNSEEKQIECIKNSLKITKDIGKVYIALAAINNENLNQNTQVRILCKNCEPFHFGYAYDQATDSYIVLCESTISLGHIPYIFRIQMDSAGWNGFVPFPEECLLEIMPPPMLSKVKEFKNKFPEPKFKIQYFQMYSR